MTDKSLLEWKSGDEEDVIAQAVIKLKDRFGLIKIKKHVADNAKLEVLCGRRQ